jgi:hypothetical protein
MAFKDRLLVFRKGLITSNVDANMYYKEKYMKRIIILLYVDDLLLTRDDKKKIKRVQKVFIEKI